MKIYGATVRQNWPSVEKRLKWNSPVKVRDVALRFLHVNLQLLRAPEDSEWRVAKEKRSRKSSCCKSWTGRFYPSLLEPGSRSCKYDMRNGRRTVERFSRRLYLSSASSSDTEVDSGCCSSGVSYAATFFCFRAKTFFFFGDGFVSASIAQLPILR